MILDFIFNIFFGVAGFICSFIPNPIKIFEPSGVLFDLFGYSSYILGYDYTINFVGVLIAESTSLFLFGLVVFIWKLIRG